MAAGRFQGSRSSPYALEAVRGPSISKAFSDAMEAVDKKVGWHRLPKPLAIPTLIGIRERLRHANLFDTGVPENGAPPFDPRYRAARTLDGTHNDLERPMMGAINTRFGRNVPPEDTFPEEPPRLLEPSPRAVSRELMTREEFLPATTLNILAAAWIQFEVHDWVFHGHNEEERPWQVEMADDDPWHERPMRIQRTQPDPSPEANGGPATWVRPSRSRNLASLGGASGEIPSTVTPAAASEAMLSRKSHASLVHPGVIAAG